jgi:hypothetical protein
MNPIHRRLASLESACCWHGNGDPAGQRLPYDRESKIAQAA